jgi:hypothetical protein
MKLNLKYANNPKWVNQDRTLINLTVRFEEIDEDLPFTADPNDLEEHGRDVFARAIAGEFGTIAEWTPPTTEELAAIARKQRDSLLQEVDSIVGNPLRWASFSQAQQTAWADYRQALLDVPQQPGFPNTINYPTKPGG